MQTQMLIDPPTHLPGYSAGMFFKKLTADRQNHAQSLQIIRGLNLQQQRHRKSDFFRMSPELDLKSNQKIYAVAIKLVVARRPNSDHAILLFFATLLNEIF